MASRPGISGHPEKSGNFVAHVKSQGISWNSEKSGNFNAKLGKVRKFCNFKLNAPHQVIQMMIINYIPVYVYKEIILNKNFFIIFIF